VAIQTHKISFNFLGRDTCKPTRKGIQNRAVMTNQPTKNIHGTGREKRFSGRPSGTPNTSRYARKSKLESKK